MRSLFTPLRTVVLLSLFLAGAGWALAPAGDAPVVRPMRLRCEYLANPIGIDVAKPRFAWWLAGAERNERQSAYRILVAKSAETLAKDQGDQWDSGKVASDDSTQIAYGGPALASGQRYFWKVRYWTASGASSAWSEPAWFEMGLLTRDEWKGQWIGGGNQLRTEFDLSANVVRARAYVAGIGYYELHVNGGKIGSNVLDPAWTTYDQRVLYTTYDVTAHLHRGRNAVGVMLGEGWYHARALKFQMNIELEGGKHLSVTSGAEWKAADGPIVSDSVWDGEVYDARRETPGWDEPGFDASGWKSAQVIEGPRGALSAEMMPTIQVVDTMVPVNMTSPQPGVYVFDMGQNMSGWAQLRVRGPRGTAVRMRYSELISDNGMINRANLRAAKSRDIYILRGEGEETYEPRFTYHGFRYVEVAGYPGTPSLDSIRGRVVHSAVPTTGSFAASKQILNQIQKIIRWAQLTNLFGIPTDCDQRNERQGWMGDAQVTAEEATLNFDMAAFYTNFIRDIRDAQKPDGEIPDTVPHRYGQYPADPAWGTAYPTLCWTMWEQYGDRRILEGNYEGLKKYVEYLRSRAPENILRIGYYGDWVAIEPTPVAYVSTAYYYHDVNILSQIAGVLGNSADATSYSQLADQIRDAFNKAFYHPETATYANGTQTAQALALYFGLVPEKERGRVAGILERDIAYTHNTHVTTGFIGVKALMPALTQIGRNDLAYDLAVQTTYPSWGYMVERGATTLWELWQEKTGPSMNSHDHAMFGSVGAWFYQALGGINLGADGAGYRHIRIEPGIVEDLNWASATLDSVRGTVSSTWSHAPGMISLDVVIPPNSDAEIVIPKEDEMSEVTVREGEHTIWEKGQFVAGDAGVANGKATEDAIILTVGSGHYTFQLSGQ